jgi:predicted DNA-binding transcriptional regulator YafY
MERLERTMGILLLLRGGRAVSATELAERFEVSPRTIYRDIEVLSGLGVPVSAEMGRSGGFRLGEGYFLPPVTLGPEEAISLIVGLCLMRRLRVMPFPKEAEFAERKLLAALPEGTARLVSGMERYIGFERVPPDLLHPEPEDPTLPAPRGEGAEGPNASREAEMVGRFLRAVLSRSRLRMRYRSPWRAAEEEKEVEARGLVWDRDRWYLAASAGPEARLWRADRVLSLEPGPSMHPVAGDFDVADLLDRRWLGEAMEAWRREAPARIAMTPAQAALLKRDWYYGRALFEEEGSRVLMSYGENSAEEASRLVLWLGPGAEILEPRDWREAVAAKCRALLEAHSD